MLNCEIFNLHVKPNMIVIRHTPIHGLRSLGVNFLFYLFVLVSNLSFQLSKTIAT